MSILVLGRRKRPQLRWDRPKTYKISQTPHFQNPWMGVVVVVVVSVDFVVVVVVVVDVVVGYSWKCFCIGQSILLLANLWGQALVSDLRKI